MTYYDTAGNVVTQFVDRPIRVQPLATLEFLVEAQDSTGGSGANFLVNWLAAKATNPPLAECVMVGAANMDSIGFSRQGIPISTNATANGESTRD